MCSVSKQPPDFPSYGGIERRSRDRFRVEIFCRVGETAQWYPARMIELSLKGAFLECELDPAEESPLAIEVAPGEKLAAVVKQKGWYLVENRKGYYLGVEFHNDDRVTSRTIGKLLEDRSQDTPAPTKFQLP